MPERGRASKNTKAKSKSGGRAKANSSKTNRTKRESGKSVSKRAAKGRGKDQAAGASKDRVAGAMSDEATRAALEASDKLYYRIGEVSQLTGVKAHVLRYWETEFRWMAPPKSRSKQRLYRKRDIQFVWLLKRLLWDERYTIAGARQRIQELGVDDALKLLDQPVGQAARDSTTSVETVAFQSALSDMKTELLAIREQLVATG